MQAYFIILSILFSLEARDIEKIKQESNVRRDKNSREIENLKLRLSAIESKPEIPPIIQKSAQSGVYFNYYGASKLGSTNTDPDGNVRIYYQSKGSERRGLFLNTINNF